MTKEAGTSAGNGKELPFQNRARYLTPQELVAHANRDLAGLLGRRKLKTVGRFISEKVTGIHLNSVDVLTIDVDHTTEIDSYIKAYMQSPRTSLILPEFFYHELIENAGILARPMRKVKQGGGAMYGARLQAAERVEQALRVAGKPVAVADIADRGSYLAWNYILRLSPVFLGGAIALATKQDLAAFAGALAGAGHASNILRHAHFGTGIFDPDADSGFERRVLDLEQARRLSLALGVRQLTTDFDHSKNQVSEIPQFVMLNPQAHGKRVADILVNPSPHLDKTLSLMYRIIGPTLHHSIRTYEWEEQQRQPTSAPREVFPIPNSDQGKWRKTAERKIKI